MSHSLESLLQTAEEALEPPGNPPGGIPKQRLHPWIRTILKLMILPFLYLELGAEKVARTLIKPPFQKVGRCKRRGNCCHYILFPETRGLLKILFLFWNTEVHGFYQRSECDYEHEGKKVLVMGCRHLRKDGSCGSYRLRPRVCRTWPIIELFGFPKVLKGCGYQAKLRKSAEKKYPALRIYQEESLS